MPTEPISNWRCKAAPCEIVEGEQKMEKKKRKWNRAAGALFSGALLAFIGVMNLGPAWEGYAADSSQGWMLGIFLLSTIFGVVEFCRGALIFWSGNKKKENKE